MLDASVLEINLSAVVRNLHTIRRMVGRHCALCPIVKADAYGLGAAKVAPALVEAGADLLAVYTPAQAAELLESGLRIAVLVMMPTRDLRPRGSLAAALDAGQVHLALHDAPQLDDLAALARRLASPLPVHLEVDTGMSRGGCPLDDAPALIRRLHEDPRLLLAGLFTHFARAEHDDPYTDRQMSIFNRLLESERDLIGPDCLVHAANSFALLRDARYHKSMVRFGLAWAGYGPEWMTGERRIDAAAPLEPVLAWSSRVVHVRTIPAGTTVGYGATWTARRRSRVGLVPVGYADGLPMGLGSTDAEPRPAVVGVRLDDESGPCRHHVPIIGAVNMDQVTIDLTDVPLPRDDARASGLGLHVELISTDRQAPNHLPTLARAAGTIPHEMLCRLNPRIPRRHVREAPVISIRPPRSAIVATSR
ncbi:MAG: alanine racemase [Planctomycetota bacterium]|jgi:alanine racemase